jgi:two-component system, NarL family, invasion response regulator UvrY
MIQVLIADAHPLVRTGLRQVLSQESDVKVAGEVENAEQVLRSVEEQPFDIVVLDITLPGRSGLEVLTEIRQRHGSLPVLMLSMHDDEHLAMRALRAGANGYLSKARAPAELGPAIRRILSGKRYLSPAVEEAMAQRGLPLDSVDPGRPPHELLSNREFQVICKIASGNSVSQIAADMGLGVKTISTYRARALEKMRMRTNAELTRYAIQNQLVE